MAHLHPHYTRRGAGEAKEFHMFRERWVKDGNMWFTRVVGLVPAKAIKERRAG